MATGRLPCASYIQEQGQVQRDLMSTNLDFQSLGAIVPMQTPVAIVTVIGFPRSACRCLCLCRCGSVLFNACRDDSALQLRLDAS